MSELVSGRVGYEAVEHEPPELAGKNVISGAHLWASATSFFFIGFLFAFFYLRSLNNGGMWHPKHVSPSLALGTASMACLVAAAVAIRLGMKSQRSGHRSEWRREGAVGLALVVASLGLQIAEWATQGFGPTQGSYASVYCGWTAVLFVFVVGTGYWLETVFATAVRYRNIPEGGDPPPGHASGDPHREAHDVADPISLVRPQLTAVSFYLDFMALIAVITWIVLYLV